MGAYLVRKLRTTHPESTHDSDGRTMEWRVGRFVGGFRSEGEDDGD